MAPAEAGFPAPAVATPSVDTAAADADSVDVELCWSPAPRRVEVIRLQLAAGSTVAQALAQAVPLAHGLPPEASGWRVAIWGRRAEPGERLAPGDRIEWLRPLKVEPKEARRLRQRQHREALELMRQRQRERKAGARGGST